jgi:hypothetical protein
MSISTIFGRIVFVFLILFSIWMICKVWSKKYPGFIAKKIQTQDMPEYVSWLLPKDPSKYVTAMRIYSIIVFVFSVVMEILLIVR